MAGITLRIKVLHILTWNQRLFLQRTKRELPAGYRVEEAIAIIFNTHIKRLRPRTIGSYKSHTHIFINWLKIEKLDSKDISSISSEIMSKFIIGLSDKGLHNTTRNHYLGTLRTFFNHLVDDKFLNNNPCKGIKKLKTVKQGSLYFKKHQIELLKKDISEKNPYLWFYIQFMYYGFLRPAEIRNLKVGDIDFGNEKIRVKANPPVSSTLTVLRVTQPPHTIKLKYPQLLYLPHQLI